MPYVWTDEVTRVPTVGANGMGVSPAVPVEEVEKVAGNVRSMKKNGKESVIPNPETVTSGKVLKASSGKWASGTDADSLPSAAGATDGQVLTVASGEWTIADNVEGVPDPSEATDGQVLTVDTGAWTIANNVEGVPDPSEATDGQVLTVATGAWTIADLPT